MTAKIPIEIISAENEGHHIIIKGKINKKNTFLMIDTGASRSVFDISLFNIKANGGRTAYQNFTSSVNMIPDEIPSANGIIQELQLQDLKISNYKTTLIDLKYINDLYKNNTGKKINGLIGNDLLIKYRAIIDYSNKVLILNY
jgi:hypothetical protein